VGWCFGRRVRLVLVSHGDVFHRPPGSYDPAITWLYRRTTRPAHRLAAANVALSPVMAERIAAQGVPVERIALIPNGLDAAEIGLAEPPCTRAEHWQQRPLRLLFVGRIDPVKGVDVLLEALALLRDRGLAMQLDLIGRASPNQSQDLDGRIRRLELGGLVDWLGVVSRHELADHYARCHLVVVPSRDEPLPTVVLEAMACGRPVLGSAVGGINFLVVQAVTGLLVPPEDPMALADAMASLDDDANGMASLAQAGLSRAGRFSWQANGKALQNLIASLPL
jgi:glycosyltransferase involved in cell wall biosynthesis